MCDGSEVLDDLRSMCTTTKEERVRWLNALHVSERTEKPTEDDMIRILNDLSAMMEDD